jgi:IclR family KDG regulon transcriptional repressor
MQDLTERDLCDIILLDKHTVCGMKRRQAVLKMSTSTRRYHIRAVERALVLLRSFLDHEAELAVAEIARFTQLDRSTVFRLLVTLEAHGFVEKNPVTGRYRLGVICLELGSRFLKSSDVRERALGVLDALRSEFGETTHLSILDGSEVVYLEKLPGLLPVGVISSRVGGRAPAYCTGVGKALLAYLPDSELQRLLSTSKLARYTDATITDLDELRAELTRILETGYAIDRQEYNIGVECVAAPIFGHDGVVAAISVSGPVERMEQHVKDRALIEKVQQAAAQISAKLGGRSMLIKRLTQVARLAAELA